MQAGNDGEITNDDGFGNCYNFVKDVMLSICKNAELGLRILLRGDSTMGDIV